MALPLGNWDINAAGFEGTLNITSVDGSGHVIGTLKLSAAAPFSIAGTWDDAQGKLVFYPVSPRAWLRPTTTYTGYLFTASAPLFGGVGLGSPLQWYMLTGYRTYVTFFVFGSSSGAGWMARKSYP